MQAQPQANGPFRVLAIYKFADLPDCAALRPALAAFCCAHRIRGTFILAPEGINGTVAGTPEAIDAVMAYLLDDAVFAGRLAGAEAKFSWASRMPFNRMKVRLKPEIVTLRAPEANPSRAVGTYVSPEDWNALIGDEDVVLVDTRNDYEVALGTFKGALDPGTTSFAGFKDFVASALDPARHRKIAMFCTGGIRCEKASSYLLSRGFEQVFHLKGGILRYLEAVPEAQSAWQGECFVFDERVALGHGLAEGEAILCRACRRPLTTADRQHSAFIDGMSCPHCAADDARRAAAAERQRQIELAGARGASHIGDDANKSAARDKALKQARRQPKRAHLPA